MGAPSPVPPLEITLLIVLVAGNNGLFLALAVMGAALVVSWVLARWNVRGLVVRLRPPVEIFAASPAHVDLELENRGRVLPRWLLLLALEARDVEPELEERGLMVPPLFVPHLGRHERHRDRVELLMRRRGRYRITAARVVSLFPLGFFRQGMRYGTAAELLVYPEIFSASASWPAQAGQAGDQPTRRAGWGYDLFGLRSFRPGDDPRGIHWKQSAKTGSLIWKEHEAEENRRLLIVFDNAVGELGSELGVKRFERLVSEAATAALDYLANGFEVALVTREESIAYAAGARQRRRILETLALVEAVPEAARPLRAPQPDLPHLRLAMEAA